MATRDDFIAAARAATADTPYLVTPTDDGFELGLNIVDATWYALFNKAGLTEEHTVKVRIEGDHYTITQGSREIEWSAGTPTAGKVEWFSGRYYSWEFRKIWALDEDFRPAKVVDYRFSPNESLRLVRAIGKKLGLKERAPLVVKIAVGFAIVAGVGALLTLLLLGGAALFAAFSPDWNWACDTTQGEHSSSSHCWIERSP